MIRMYNAKGGYDYADDAAARIKEKKKRDKGKISRSKTPEPERPPRPWHVAKKSPKPFGLSDADLAYLKANTHFDEKEIKGWYRGFKTDCPDGNLSRAKILEVVGLILPEDEGKAFVDQVFRIFDKDGNGSIDFKEFMMATDMTSAGTPEEKLKWTFKLYDKDCSGTIDLSEMVEAIDTLYAMENRTGEVSKDKKGSGASAVSLTKAKKLFNALDANGDGNLTQEEFVNGCMADQDLVYMLTSSPGDIDINNEVRECEKDNNRRRRKHRRSIPEEVQQEQQEDKSSSG